jgi:hypothetical protein
MCNCTSENLEIPGLVLTHHPGMTVMDCFASLALTEGNQCPLWSFFIAANCSGLAAP